MRNLLALTSRELKAFWYSPLAYVVGAVFLLLQGADYAILMRVLNDARVDPSITLAQIFFGAWWYYWFSVIVAAAALTMRTFSEEKRTGSIELLLSAPVTDTQVVVAKFLGAWTAYLALWACPAVFFLLLRRYTTVEWGPVATGYLGTALLGAVLIAAGVLASSLTRNQVIAFILSFVAMVLLFSLGILDVFIQDPEMSAIVRYLSLIEHFRDFSKGILDTRPVVFYLSLTAICLFLTVRVIGSPRWRS